MTEYAPSSEPMSTVGPAVPLAGGDPASSTPTGVVDDRPVASVSLDADNLWSYLRTHGDARWAERPSYLGPLGARMREVFAAHGLTPTVFVVGSDAATAEGREFVAGLSEFGCEIGNHSYEHEPWLHLYDRGRLRDEIARTEEAIMAAGAPKPVGFRAPGYSMSPDLMTTLVELGYAYDASVLATWIGPVARAYYLRTNPDLTPEERAKRKALFGSLWDAALPNKGFTWTGSGADSAGEVSLPELPVTVFPGARVPMHVSYVLYLDALSPRLAKAYLATALRACRLSGTAPSLLLHPLDLLDASDAPGLEFFPGMQLSAARKRRVLDAILEHLTTHYRVVGTAAHAGSTRRTRRRSTAVLARGRAEATR